jgi:hypothetical protein
VTVHFIEAVGGVDSSSTSGLTTSEVAQRLAVDGPNELPTAKPRDLVQQARDVLREPMLLLLVGAGVLYFVLAEPLDGVILMSFVVVVIPSRFTRHTRPRTRSLHCAISLPLARSSFETDSSSGSLAATSSGAMLCCSPKATAYPPTACSSTAST